AAVFAAAQAGGPDFVDVKGQESAKSAVEVAVAGGHNILLVGPPGTGKSMLARRIPSILPPLSVDEALELTKIHSIAGLLPPGVPLLATRPFRSPHHTVSDVALVGGGTRPAPGEVSLAHDGVLFLDELPEFGRNALEVLRQPLEDGFVTISRASGTARYPSRFMLVAAMNPCPCGHFGDPNRQCRCTRMQIQRYRSRISGPLLDRIDLHVSVAASRLRDLQSIPAGESSEAMRARVSAARAVQAARFADRPGPRTNAAMTRRDVERFCHMDAACLQVMNFAINDMKFSPRAHDRILKVARTVADLAGHEELRPSDLRAAVAFRSLDRSLWD
ncbi:MAG: YifB family Mg chelatase-like AAA ATPase, partial [Kiritimatiellae bacterium]|nr:YifB family Mg chelatase-like AAA ATPase [Kiritimatiellia bacterium]